jgi:hypothetical protein
MAATLRSATRDLISSANTGLCTGRGDSPAGTIFRHTGRKLDGLHRPLRLGSPIGLPAGSRHKGPGANTGRSHLKRE